MANYNIPEGFSFDEGSGYYYQSVISQDQSGNQIQLVTWFNPQTGESVQQRYPETGEPIQQEYSEAEGSIQQNNSEIEFSYDETSGLYYKIEEGNNAAGKRIQSVTWYNPQTGEYQVVETEIEMTAQKEELVNGPQRVSYREKENITRKEDANKVKGKTIAIIIALFLVAANVVTACMYSIPYYKDNRSEERRVGKEC